MLISNFSGREKYLAIATISLVLAAAVYLFLIAPLYGGWNSMHNQIRARVDILEKDHKILANQKTLISEYSGLSKHAKSGGSEEEAVVDTLAYIENVLKNDSCSIVNIKPMGVTDAGSYKEILVEVTAEGSIEQLSKFLYDMENPGENLISIKRVTLSLKSTQTGTLKGTFFIAKALLE